MPELWENKRVVVLGLARQGKALARHLADEGAMVIVSDLKSRDQLASEINELEHLGLTYALGEHPVDLLEGAQALFLSGGVPADLPIALKARALGIPVLNDAQLFLESCPAPVIGITGSAGKSTTTTLVDKMVRAGSGARRNVWLGGNIGRSLLDDLSAITPEDVVVMELSSFQLELMTISPQVAALLNLTPDHLDRHGSMERYVEAKRRIVINQAVGSTLVLGFDDPRTWMLRGDARGRVISFGFGKPVNGDAAFVEEDRVVLRLDGQDHVICALDELALPGPHNVLNVLAACALSSVVETPAGAMAEIAQTFRGIPHRMEFVRTGLGADWYNDSIATTPARALAALRSFEAPLIVLLGGRDKELPWDSFAGEVITRARAIVLFGEAAGKLESVLQPLVKDMTVPEVVKVDGLEQAISAAARLVQDGDVVLLSPGCTSYDEFPNFEIRGDRFREIVRSL